MATDLEALKAAHVQAKAAHREAVKAIVEAKRAADAARRRARETFTAYLAARPPGGRPRAKPKRKRVVDPDADNPFAPEAPPAAT